MKFEIGNKVMLKSGGPKMTIKEISEETAICEWKSETGIKEQDFKTKSIKLVKENSKENFKENDVFDQALKHVVNKDYTAFKDLMKPALSSYIKYKNDEEVKNLKQELKDRKNLYK